MAQPGRNGQHDEHLNEGSQYVFNPMTFNYHGNQVFTTPTVLSQQDASLMADFFKNPDNPSTNESYLTFGFEPRVDLMSGAGSPDGAEGDASLANTTIAHVPNAQGMYNHNMLQVAPTTYSTNDFSNNFLPTQQTHMQGITTGGDAVAGASTLISLSASQDQHSNPLNANNYMGWGSIFAAQTVTGPNRQSITTAPRGPPVKSNSTSQVQPQLHTPPGSANWAEITNQAHMQRARHSSLQLDTSASTAPNHQATWQQAPQSAFPQAKSRARPSLATFGSDERFGSTGYVPSAQQSPEPRYMHIANIGDIAIPQAGLHSSGDIRQLQQFQQRHNIGAQQQNINSAQSSPATIGGLPTPANSVGAVTSQVQARKRGAAHFDEDDSIQRRLEPSGSPVGKLNAKRRKSSAQQGQATAGKDASTTPVTSTNGTDGVETATAPRNRRGREAKAPRQNLTDEQKRNNHIASEQKRRDAMKTNFEELNKIVPALMAGGAGLSRSEILQHTGNALESCKTGNVVIARLLGIDLDMLDRQDDDGSADAAGEESNSG